MKDMMRVLIAYDGSPSADAALEGLRRAGLPTDVEAVVMTVADVWPPSSYEVDAPPITDSLPAAVKMARAQAAQAVQEAQALADHAVFVLKSIFPTWVIQAEAIADSPAWAIIKKAEEWQADLVVVGSHGKSALHRFVLGSVSQKVLTEVRTAVRVARDGTKTADQPIRLVVGVDGSPGADAAVKAMVARDWPAGSEALIIAVVDTRMSVVDNPLTPTTETWVEASREDTNHWVDEVISLAADELNLAGLQVQTLVADGDPKHVLLEEAEKFGADTIFVGASGLTRRGYLVLGSVSTAVAARAFCSVEVVRTQS